ncbi:unnamed protein product [Effrenium voratum]|uniref:Uncharacterized protein n=1 Tax=Effrenium voratum TaxID=2562239 RepID=A0AA36HZR1_9DINO|nr:unnamed protein product [Effrenium voratum]
MPEDKCDKLHLPGISKYRCIQAIAGGAFVLALTFFSSPVVPLRPHNLEDAVRLLSEIETDRSKETARRLASLDAEEPSFGLSPKPWFQEVVDRYGAPVRQNPQRYATQVTSGRRLAVLAENNTAPIRIHLNFDTLYEDKVQASPFAKDRYCFREGAWFRTGYPGEKPASGPDECGDRSTTPVTGDMWCICRASDVITDEMRSFVIQATTEVMKQLPTFIGLKPVQGPLRFRNAEGSYPAMWKATGQSGDCCDPDCQKGLHVVVPEFFCSLGVEDADAVLSVTMPPPLPGVGGAGTFCSADQHGRPTHLVFQWHRRILEAQFASSSVEELIPQWRGLVLHEAFHGLGFGSGIWQNSYSSDGGRRQILRQLEVTDQDGSKDFVYHFVKGTRTYDVAKVYFGCQEEDWQGLPLMSWPPSGRDTHHETRLMRDDVMSYGNGLKAVSAITLAALEDTGHYLANYSSAECMWWGRGRGCDFVSSRCTVRPDGEVFSGAEAAQCDRVWSSRYTSGNREALRKCVQPQCESRTSGGTTICDAECFTGTDTTLSCTQVPSGDVAEAGVAGWANDLAAELLSYDVTWESLRNTAEICLAPLLLLSTCCFARCILCPSRRPGRIKTLFYTLSVASVLPGITLFAAGGYASINWSDFEVFFTMEFIIGVQILGLSVMMIEGFGTYAVYFGDRGKQICFCILHSLELLALLGAVAMIAKFAMDLDNLSTDALSQAGVTPAPSIMSFGWAQRMADQILNELMSVSCRTYQVCCENKDLLDSLVANGAPRQCKVGHQGLEADAGFVLSDPSHPSFCAAVSGVSSRTAFPSLICEWMDTQAANFSVDQCKQDYCTAGLRGFHKFLSSGAAVYKQNMRTLGLALGFFVALQMVQLVIVVRLPQHKRLSRVLPGDHSSESFGEDLQTVIPRARPGARNGTQVASGFADEHLVQENGYGRNSAWCFVRTCSVSQQSCWAQETCEAKPQVLGEKKHLCLTTGTSSGKSLAFALPILEAYRQDPKSRALVLFPTKALAQDQLGKLQKLFQQVCPGLGVCTFDGDTPKDDRARLLKSCHVFLTNPDMLHFTILAAHLRWRHVLENLRYMVLDEAHVYRGSFGAHVALLLRRFRRVLKHYNSSPLFIACSATMCNAGSFFAKLLALESSEQVCVVDEDTAGRGDRQFCLWNPPLLEVDEGQPSREDQNARKRARYGEREGKGSAPRLPPGVGYRTRSSSYNEAAWIVSQAARRGHRTVCFLQVRAMVEVVLQAANQHLEDRPDLQGRIAGYRGGYAALERRKLERRLFTGDLLCVVATNALELGIDIGDLDLTLHVGVPPTVASVWQQAGRAGRRGRPSAAILIAMDAPLEQHFCRHPEEFFSRSIEARVPDTSNELLLKGHMLCAAAELTPLSESDAQRWFGDVARVQDELIREGRLVAQPVKPGGPQIGPLLRVTQGKGRRPPKEEVSLRDIDPIQFQVVVRGNISPLETLDQKLAFMRLHPGAIYLNQQTSYFVEELDLTKKIAWVIPRDSKKIDYYTECREHSAIILAGGGLARAAVLPLAQQASSVPLIRSGQATVHWRMYGFRKKSKRDHNLLDQVDLTLPAVEFPTRATWMDLPGAVLQPIAQEGHSVDRGGLHALEHAMMAIAPLCCDIEVSELSCQHTRRDSDPNRYFLLFYENQKGGSGAAEKMYKSWEELLAQAFRLMQECSCDKGCPNCIVISGCGDYNHGLDKAVALKIGKALGYGTQKGNAAPPPSEQPQGFGRRLNGEGAKICLDLD